MRKACPLSVPPSMPWSWESTRNNVEVRIALKKGNLLRDKGLYKVTKKTGQPSFGLFVNESPISRR